MLNGYPFNIWQGGETSPVDPLKHKKIRFHFNGRLRPRSGRTFFAEGFSHSGHSLFETELSGCAETGPGQPKPA